MKTNRKKAQGSRWPAHGEDEHTATCFQLCHDPDFPKAERWSRFDAGDRVTYPLGKAVVTWLDEETGDCLLRPTIQPGDKVRPISGSLWLADAPMDGTHGQKRLNACVLSGEGTVLETRMVVVDYDKWGLVDDPDGGEPLDYRGIGKMAFQDCLVRCKAGTGWGTALAKA